MEKNNVTNFVNKVSGIAEKPNLEDAQKYWAKIKNPYTECVERISKFNEEEYMVGKLLNREELIDKIDMLYKKGVLFLYFTGVEVLDSNDFIDVYMYAKNKGFIIEVMSDAKFINEETIEIFNKYPPEKVTINMYGKNKKSFEEVTGVKGSYNEFIESINILLKNKINLEIKFISNINNVGDFNEVEEYARSIGANVTFKLKMFTNLLINNSPNFHKVNCEDVIRTKQDNIILLQR